ncbi:MAG: hypothetical protein WBD40_22310 [Tepidisphaeraceae bacterium]
MEDGDRILNYANMRPKRLRWWATAVTAMLVSYLSGYGAYRSSTAVVKAYLCGGGPPALLISLESPTRKAVYQLYRPCIAAEECWYWLTYSA